MSSLGRREEKVLEEAIVLRGVRLLSSGIRAGRLFVFYNREKEKRIHHAAKKGEIVT
jgi:hypothetical protein